MKSPCYQCKNRGFKCHSTCEFYQNWKDEKNRLNLEIKKIKKEYYNANF